MNGFSTAIRKSCAETKSVSRIPQTNISSDMSAGPSAACQQETGCAVIHVENFIFAFCRHDGFYNVFNFRQGCDFHQAFGWCRFCKINFQVSSIDGWIYQPIFKLNRHIIGAMQNDGMIKCLNFRVFEFLKHLVRRLHAFKL